MSFTLAIVGRPNVGKSTLFNRLAGKQHAIVDDTPGVTRDWREGEGNIGPLEFRVIDTAGLEQSAKDTLAARMTAHSMLAIEEANVVLFVVDGRAGITPVDQHFAGILRKTGKPVVIAVNKAEGRAGDATVMEANTLGFGSAIPISAAHGEGMGDLYDALAPFESLVVSRESAEEDILTTNDQRLTTPLSIAIVGRPNAGKSTLANALIGKERMLTGPEAGITRDAISADFEWEGHHFTLVDTAGMRKRAKVDAGLEKLSVSDTLRAIRYAQVVVLMVDASSPLDKQDIQIASLVEQEGRALVLAINKWDLATDKKAWMRAIEERVGTVMAQVRGVPLVTLSAERREGLSQLMKAVLGAYAVWNMRIPTGQLNRWLEGALEAHMPPMIDGRRLKIRYVTQAKTRPPTFVFSANISPLPDHYARYLINTLRETFDMPGTPIRLKVKKSKNPYGEKDD